MEIPVINRITDFDAGVVASLPNPSLVPKIFALSSISELVHQASSFWKWGALIVALLASFTTVISSIKIFIIRFQSHHLSSVSKPLLGKHQDYDFDITSCSSVSEDDEDDDDDDDGDVTVASSCSQKWTFGDEDFRVKGSSSGDCYIDEDWTNPFSWPEFPTGKNVVNIWDNYIGFDMSKQQNICSIFGSPSVVVSAETSVSRNLLKVWDTRVGCRIPQILADWRPRLGRTVGVYAAGGIEKIYVTDDAITGGLTVADGRKLGSPLVNAAEADQDTWWDADAVIVGDESVDESRGWL